MTTDTEQHVDPLTAMLYPAYTKRCEYCGGFVVTTPEEAIRRYTEAAYEPLAALAEALQDPSPAAIGLPTMAAGTMFTGAAPRTRGHHAHRKHAHRHRDCGCEDHHHRCRRCGRDDCHCRCCVIDADLVVHARLGERRVVPITIENNRRREREVRVELSEFTSRGGSGTKVAGRLASPAEFTLAACEEREVVVVIDVDTRAEEGDEKDKSARERGEQERLPDVDDCVVAYADLRVVGCETRPIRIAVTTLPRDCHSYPVDCASACCC